MKTTYELKLKQLNFFSLETVPTREESMLVNSAVPLVTRTTRNLLNVQQRREIKCHKRKKMKSKYPLEML